VAAVGAPDAGSSAPAPPPPLSWEQQERQRLARDAREWQAHDVAMASAAEVLRSPTGSGGGGGGGGGGGAMLH